jgi:hypothetical protein
LFWQGLQLGGSQSDLGAFSHGSQQSHAQPEAVVSKRAQARASIAMRFMKRLLALLSERVS